MSDNYPSIYANVEGDELIIMGEEEAGLFEGKEGQANNCLKGKP